MSDDNGTLHKGHRKRQRELFIKNGLDAFADHGVLELLLFYAIPRGDTNALAHRLINRFGTLAGVLDASFDELQKVEGIGENAAAFLKLIPQVCSRYYASRTERGCILDTTESIGEYFLPMFIGERDEVVYIITMDSKRKVIASHFMNRGSVNVAQVSARKIAERALADNAVFVAIAHNHVGAYALPSPDDVNATKTLMAALSALDIRLVDHLVFDENDYVSMRDSGLLRF